MPTAYFTIGSKCSSDHFVAQRIIINTDLCSFGAQGFPNGTLGCEDTVRYHPELYKEAYWTINYLNVYCKAGENCLTSK